jgi:hypothetical protein
MPPLKRPTCTGCWIVMSCQEEQAPGYHSSRSRALAVAAPVGDLPGNLYREPEMLGNRGGPAGICFGLIGAVKGRVDLHGRQAPGIALQVGPLLRKPMRVLPGNGPSRATHLHGHVRSVHSMHQWPLLTPSDFQPQVALREMQSHRGRSSRHPTSPGDQGSPGSFNGSAV